MTMKKTLIRISLFVLFILTAHTASTQVKNSIAKIHAYIQETFAGNIQVDEKGNPLSNGVDHIHHFYVETTGKQLPIWNILYTHYGVFSLEAEAIDSGKVTVGTLKSTNKVVVITPKRGNRLWKLALIPMKASTPNAVAALLKKNDAVLITEFGNRKFTHIIAKEMELTPIYYQ